VKTVYTIRAIIDGTLDQLTIRFKRAERQFASTWSRPPILKRVTLVLPCGMTSKR
jgi:hypothetical protein